MINGEQSLCWLWFIHHVSQEVGPRRTEMNEETFRVAAGKEEVTETAGEHRVPKLPPVLCTGVDLTPQRPSSLSARGTQTDNPSMLYLSVRYVCTLRNKKTSVY